jgi:hypothetical protein
MRRSTLVILLLFLALAGAYYFLNNRPEPENEATTPEPTAEITYLFTAEEGTPTSIRIESKAGEVVEVTRDAENAWALILPEKAAADPGSTEAAASQVTTMRILERLPTVAAEAVGLDLPDYKLVVKFTSGVERIIEIGVITPTESGYYVRASDGGIVIVSRSAVDSLLTLLTDPPYLETPIPLPPTPEPGAPANETVTPQP